MKAATITDQSDRLSADELLEALQAVMAAQTRLCAAMHRRFPSADGAGVTPFVLRAVHRAGRRGVSQADLARSLDRTASWTTRLIDHLEQDGFVTRCAHPTDRRINMIALTPAGDRALAQISTDLTLNGESFEFLDRAAKDAFVSQLSRLAQVASEIIAR